jgi:hypothetical protein
VNQLTSYDFHGLLTNPRTEKLFTRTDPLGYRRDFRYEFELGVMDAIETESQVVTQVEGHVLKEGPTYHDCFAFGTSLRDAEKDATRQMERVTGATVDVVIVTTAICTPVFLDPYEAPFYVGSARCFHVPYHWRPQDNPKRELGWKKTFEVWKNGAPGADRAAFDDFVKETRANDVGEPYRKKRATA